MRMKKTIKSLFEAMQLTYQKMGLIKYDAFNEMGGKLSFFSCHAGWGITDLSSMPCTHAKVAIHISKRS